MHRRFLHVLLILLALLTAAAISRAGIYNTAETEEIHLEAAFIKPDGSGFKKTLKDVWSVSYPEVLYDMPVRKRYLLWEALPGKSPPRDLTVEQEIDYTAVLIRRKSPEAVPYLERITRRFPDNFLLQSHLAHAYWLAGPGNEGRAIDVLHRLLSKKAWPELFSDMDQEHRDFFVKIGWSEPPTDFYRRVEGYLLKLMRLRSKEPPGQPFQAVDAIFDGGTPVAPVRFVNDKGEFEPGKVSTAEKKKLPKDAHDIVQQLLLWSPGDLRLYWLLGEIYNAEGTKEGMIAADNIFDDLVFNYNQRAPELRKRRQELRDHVKDFGDKGMAEDAFDQKLKVIENADKTPAPLLPMTPQTIAVTFASGFVVGLFALWQFQELRRRRRS